MAYFLHSIHNNPESAGEVDKGIPVHRHYVEIREYISDMRRALFLLIQFPFAILV
jgi:hypothetical protein